jgi:hypothetical protein
VSRFLADVVFDAWQRGANRALSQDTHERINAAHYPGTRQICCECSEPTGRCEEDDLWWGDLGPLCPACYEQRNPSP